MTRKRLVIAVSLLLGVSACSGAAADNPEVSYRKGLAALDAGDPRTAKVELLNAIDGAPADPRIRIAQARTHLLLGDGIAAEAELLRARKLGVRASELHHLLAHAYFLQKKFDEAAAEAEQAPPAHRAYGVRMAGRAYYALGALEKAADAFTDAMAAGADDTWVWTDVARFRRNTGALGEAMAAADRAIALDPDNVEALTLRGELTRSQYGLAAAIPWFDKALAIDSNSVLALSERAATLADLGRMHAMLADSRRILAIQSDHPVPWFLQAMLAARAGKFPLARTLYDRTGGALELQPAGLLLAGIIDLQTGRSEQAVVRLRSLLDMQPANFKARRLLAVAQWRQGDAAATVETLRPLADRPDADPYVLSLIGKAFQRRGNADLAAHYLARAAQPQRRDAVALLSGPVDDATLDDLRVRADANPRDASLQVDLVRALLGRGNGGEALARARALQAAFPGAPDAQMLVGDALGIQGNFAAAAQEYRKAANIAFTEPVAMRLIEALRNSGNEPAATRVLTLFLAQNPQNVPAQQLAAASFLKARQWDEAIALYEGLRRRLGNRDATLLNNLAWAYSEKGAFDRAIPLARRAYALDPRNPATADTLGWLLYKSGEARMEGLALLDRAARGAPSDAAIRAHLAAAGGAGA
ncbi:tetratricopeptide repeat protein [Sphingosinicella sp. BN140058]|uniref:tetratricopeptide repeat protein n=1 Tax=Sphingosinicella sp. BN140058 TaxID=1892855 RepID=UPI0010132E2B|nr:tetratricopeptide repeat protein [Sphingosinicella sp. BN140058]QAY76215.1 tetratricopeptide repeat protein [Sphingosinicella sp. BN140058]